MFLVEFGNVISIIAIKGLQSIYDYLNYGWDLHETCVYVDNLKIYFDHYHLMVLLVAQYPFNDVLNVVCNGCVN
jgi:hypothetical protein